jgi:hypothetical protein
MIDDATSGNARRFSFLNSPGATKRQISHSRYGMQIAMEA